MDKLTIISVVLFFLADISAIISISMPDWIITDVGGNCRNAIFSYCLYSPWPCMSFIYADEIKIKITLNQFEIANCEKTT